MWYVGGSRPDRAQEGRFSSGYTCTQRFSRRKCLFLASYKSLNSESLNICCFTSNSQGTIYIMGGVYSAGAGELWLSKLTPWLWDI